MGGGADRAACGATARPACAGSRAAPPPSKLERAGLLLLALAALLLRGGERVRLLAPAARTAVRPRRAGAAGRASWTRLPTGDGLPPEVGLPRHARVVLIGDFLAPLDDIQAAIGRLAAVPVTGHLLQVLDPAEALLPYAGRVRFEGLRARGCRR